MFEINLAAPGGDLSSIREWSDFSGMPGCPLDGLSYFQDKFEKVAEESMHPTRPIHHLALCATDAADVERCMGYMMRSLAGSEEKDDSSFSGARK